jgi:large subunit ribosomal protein L35
MPKQKSHKGLSKRVKITAIGKIKHRRAGRSHLMSGKNAKRRRRLRGSAVFSGFAAEKYRVKL